MDNYSTDACAREMATCISTAMADSCLDNCISTANGFYGLLGLRPEATDTAISAAFTSISQDPGNNLTDGPIALAYEILSDPTKRNHYNIAHGYSCAIEDQGVTPDETMDTLMQEGIGEPPLPKAKAKGKAKAPPSWHVERQQPRSSQDEAVVAYVGPADAQMSEPACWNSHRYAKKPRRDCNTYTCFGAATAGCLLCVRHGIEDCGVDPTVTSDTCGYSLESFAAWADGKDNKKPTADHAGVLRYLHDLQKPVAVPEDTVPNTGVWAEGAGQTQTVDVLDL